MSAVGYLDASVDGCKSYLSHCHGWSGRVMAHCILWLPGALLL